MENGTSRSPSSPPSSPSTPGLFPPRRNSLTLIPTSLQSSSPNKFSPTGIPLKAPDQDAGQEVSDKGAPPGNSRDAAANAANENKETSSYAKGEIKETSSDDDGEKILNPTVDVAILVASSSSSVAPNSSPPSKSSPPTSPVPPVVDVREPVTSNENDATPKQETTTATTKSSRNDKRSTSPPPLQKRKNNVTPNLKSDLNANARRDARVTDHGVTRSEINELNVVGVGPTDATIRRDARITDHGVTRKEINDLNVGVGPTDATIRRDARVTDHGVTRKEINELNVGVGPTEGTIRRDARITDHGVTRDEIALQDLNGGETNAPDATSDVRHANSYMSSSTPAPPTSPPSLGSAGFVKVKFSPLPRPSFHVRPSEAPLAEVLDLEDWLSGGAVPVVGESASRPGAALSSMSRPETVPTRFPKSFDFKTADPANRGYSNVNVFIDNQSCTVETAPHDDDIRTNIVDYYDGQNRLEGKGGKLRKVLPTAPPPPLDDLLLASVPKEVKLRRRAVKRRRDIARSVHVCITSSLAFSSFYSIISSPFKTSLTQYTAG